jgi:hypothetical protein
MFNFGISHRFSVDEVVCLDRLSPGDADESAVVGQEIHLDDFFPCELMMTDSAGKHLS